MDINKVTLKAFRQDFSSTVKELEEKYGVSIALGSITFSETEFHGKVTCKKLGEDKMPFANPSNFKFLKDMLGFKGNIGDSYTAKGITFTVYDLDGKKPKFPVLIKGSDGKSYKTTVDSANFSLMVESKRKNKVV